MKLTPRMVWLASSSGGCANDSVWNFAAAHSLVIVTANVPQSAGQRVDIEILDGSERGNVYLSKRVCADGSEVPHN